MFDTMTMTKIVGGLCGTLLVFMLGGWAAESIYAAEGGHGEEAEQGYLIEIADNGDTPAEDAAAEGPTFEELYANADPAAGEALWRNCRSCHSHEQGVNMTGPSLFGVVGRPVDSIADFSYSGALEAVADTWTPENLDHFLTNPRGFAPGTAMTYSGMRKPEDRANLIAYLDSLDN